MSKSESAGKKFEQQRGRKVKWRSASKKSDEE